MELIIAGITLEHVRYSLEVQGGTLIFEKNNVICFIESLLKMMKIAFYTLCD